MAQSKTKTTRARTYARNRATASSQAPAVALEADSTYFLKLVIVVLLGTFWLKLKIPLTWQGLTLVAFPLGMVAGLIGIRLLEKNTFDRKIWYAVIIIVSIICYFGAAGIVI